MDVPLDIYNPVARHRDPTKRDRPKWKREGSGRLVRSADKPFCEKLGERRSRFHAGAEDVKYDWSDEAMWERYCAAMTVVHISPLTEEEDVKLQPKGGEGRESSVLTLKQRTYYALAMVSMEDKEVKGDKWGVTECTETQTWHTTLPITLYFTYNIAPVLIGKDNAAAIVYEIDPYTGEAGEYLGDSWARRERVEIEEETKFHTGDSVYDPNWGNRRKMDFVTSHVDDFVNHFPDRKMWIGLLGVPEHFTSFVVDFEKSRVELYDSSMQAHALQEDFFHIFGIVLSNKFDTKFERFVCADYVEDPRLIRLFEEKLSRDEESQCGYLVANPMLQQRETELIPQ